MKIGVLALQGNYDKHRNILSLLGMQSELIRYPEQLDEISGLIIPGGESTTISKLINDTGFRQPLLSFSQQYPIMGTCAGLIIMANLHQDDLRIDTLGIIDASVTRNAYGRQCESFIDEIVVNEKHIMASFIRAPKINTVGANVEVLSEYENTPVAIRHGLHFGLTFHPELNDVTLFHKLAFGGV